jgi:hypothetical chaperone protein
MALEATIRKTRRCVAAIDFGTSNSAVCIVNEGGAHLVPLEHGRHTIPTAVFYNAEQRATVFGRQALQQYAEGTEGRCSKPSCNRASRRRLSPA